MSLPGFSIDRHALTLMVSLALVLFGIIGFNRLPVDKFPEIEFPVVSVVTTLPGADPDIVDKNITDVIEETVNQVPGVKSVVSTSSLGASVVTVEFELEKDVDVAYQEVKAKVDESIKRLPDDADVPVVRKVEVGATAVMWLSLRGNRTLQQLNTYADEVVKPRLETLPGVGLIRIGGELKRTIRVWLDSERLRAFDLTGLEVRDALLREHVVRPGGFLDSRSRELLIKFDAEFNRIEDLEQLIITYRQGTPIYLHQVARVEDGIEDLRKIARFNGKPAVGVGVVKATGANVVALVDRVRDRVENELRPNLPPGMTLDYASDDSVAIRASVAALNEHLLLGTLFAAIMVFLFLRSLRSTIIIATAIPVSLFATFAAMYFAGFTLNKVTLLGMLLLIGVVVDDAIVVLENIYRHREEARESMREAAETGSNEVVFAVLASTLTLVSIFLPIAFISGILGKFLNSFALVVVIGLLASLWVSLTLTPMLCSRFLSLPTHRSGPYRVLERGFVALENGYRMLLGAGLRHRWTVVLVAIAVVASSVFFFARVGKTFVPDEDEGRFIVRMKAPLGSNFDYTFEKLKAVEQVLARYPQLRSYFSAIGLGEVGRVNEGIFFVRMVDREQRSENQFEVMAQLRRELNQIPGIRAFPAAISPIGGQRGEPLQFAVQGPDLFEIDRLTNLMMERLGAVEGIAKLDKGLELDLPETRLVLDRERAAQLGVSAITVAQTLNIMTNGLDVAQFKSASKRYDIRMQVPPEARSRLDDLKRLYVRGSQNELIRLDTLVRFEEGVGPAVITRRNRQYSGFIFGDLEGIPLGTATEAVDRLAAELLPPGYGISYTGQAEEFAKTGQYVIFAFSMALLMVYIVLASQFNSYLQPLYVQLAQPLAIIGGVAALWAFGDTLNLFSMIGMILLMGLVAKNSILLIDLTNRYRRQGQGLTDALEHACPRRLRPILITSLTVIAAMLPAAIGLGPGVETNRPIALVIIGGMISSTLLTLVVVPAVYSLAEGGIERWRDRGSLRGRSTATD